MTEPETELVRGPYTIEESRIVRERQAARSKVMAVILIALCVLFFTITLVKIGLM
jgi:hypothetical protein